MEKPPSQSKLFPAKISFSKIQKKNLAGKNYFAKKRGPFRNFKFSGHFVNPAENTAESYNAKNVGVKNCSHF
jgi:hypothetical protein